MTYLMAIVLGVVQGVAEFLPISSSGHLTLFQHFFGMETPDALFTILLHFATLLAVCVYYWDDIWEMVLEFFRFFGDLFSRTPSRGEPPVRITLYQAMPKGDKLEFIVQKAVELGAAEIVPVLTSRCISRPDPRTMEKKRERLQKIALEAAKQSGRGMIPRVGPLLSWKEALEGMNRDQLAILFYEEAREPLGPLLRSRPASVSLLIGSEGGFSPEEAREAEERGLRPCTMGPRILRCETAPLYALSAITYSYENQEETQT